jgi:RNA polymerase-binding transcription factor DksA
MNERTAVSKELERIQQLIDRLEKALAEKPDYGLGEGDPAIVRWEMNRALLEQSRERAASLKKAMDRLEDGQYGTCVQCGQPIHPDRLAVMPGTQLCIACARAKE